jgi:L-fuconolactonase
MKKTRRQVLLSGVKFAGASAMLGAAGGVFGGGLVQGSFADEGQSSPYGPLPGELIIDTHQHLWSMRQTTPPWLAGAAEVLRQDYGVAEYRAAIGPLKMLAVYMEVDVATEDHVTEARQVLAEIAKPDAITIAAVIGGRPNGTHFVDYLDQVVPGDGADRGKVKGLRQVLHGGQTPAGYCLQAEFVRGVRELGKRGLMYDICMRPGELQDAAKLVAQVPETHFILDHCGNADVKAFRSGAESPSHSPQEWRRGIEAIAKYPNVTCKISGIIASAPADWRADDLAVIINHCLDTFGPDRVVFGSDWPVCLLGAPLLAWVAALHQIVSSRSAAEQTKLWSGNAKRIYRLAS